MSGTVVTGGCLCGAVRYEYDGEVGPAGICHCADCRRVTGSAFNVSVPMKQAQFRLVSGALKSFTVRAESGNDVTRCFCPDCGSPIYTLPPHRPDTYFVKAGTLDDPGLVRPAHQAWTRSAVAWAHIPPELPSFEKGRT